MALVTVVSLPAPAQPIRQADQLNAGQVYPAQYRPDAPYLFSGLDWAGQQDGGQPDCQTQ